MMANETMLTRAQNARMILQFIRADYSIIYDDICKYILGITEEEVEEVKFTLAQYDKLKAMAEKHGYMPEKSIEQILFGDAQGMRDDPQGTFISLTVKDGIYLDGEVG
jgi:hypothetical protein